MAPPMKVFPRMITPDSGCRLKNQATCLTVGYSLT